MENKKFQAIPFAYAVRRLDTVLSVVASWLAGEAFTAAPETLSIEDRYTARELLGSKYFERHPAHAHLRSNYETAIRFVRDFDKLLESDAIPDDVGRHLPILRQIHYGLADFIDEVGLPGIQSAPLRMQGDRCV